MKSLNNHISAMLAKITNTSYKKDTQEEQLTGISSKLLSVDLVLTNKNKNQSEQETIFDQ